MSSPSVSSKNANNISAGAHLMGEFLSNDWVIELANRFLRKLEDMPEGVCEANLENLANPAVKALIMASIFKHTRRSMLMLCSEPHHVQKYRYELRQYLPNHQVEAYPVEEFSPYDQSGFPVSSLREHHRLLTRLIKNKDSDQKIETDPFILILSPKNMLLKHMAYDELIRHSIHLDKSIEISPEALAQKCLELGYLRNSLIMEPGEFSSRGDIFDLYPVNGAPVRIEFFGDSIENIRQIDVENQRSVEAVDSVLAIPRSGIVLTPEHREALIKALKSRLKKQGKSLNETELEGLESTIENQIQALDQEFLPDGIDYYAPLVHAKKAEDYRTIIDYLPSDSVVVLDDWAVMTNNLAGLSDRLSTQYREGIEKGRLLDLDFCYHLTDEEALSKLKERLPRRLVLDTLPIMADGQISMEALKHLYPVQVQAPDRFKADLSKAAQQFQDFRRKDFRVFVTSDHPQRVLDACKENDVPVIYWSDEGISQEDASWQEGRDVIVSKNGPQEGFILPDEKIIHYTDTELFGRSQKRLIVDRKAGARRDDIDVINSVNDLRPGDYVVHVKHGIGEFKKLAQIEMDGEVREYLTVQYSGTDRLHVPVDQVNMLSRYRGAGDKPPKLSKMGGTDWNKLKKKAKKSIANIARELMQLYARRAKVSGYTFDGDSPWQVEMEEAFPFTETPDQWQAILDMKADMESDKVMDRLICGDVGFGKTEVALRGIFKAVLSGKQVAVLAPTTILVQQHFNTLSERFKPYPVRMGLLSRFRSPKEQKEVVKRLALGEVDVLVGTHRLLQRDINFKDLGLLVIDEEQRFGVAHKEKIKQIRAELDVLTLSATPIPRTLYMSLSGVREMSLIKTAPTNRLPIQTFVGPYNPAQIRMAILQEIDRGGQVYFLHNRVQSIYQKMEELQALVPEVRFCVGHGQMSGDDLETVMLGLAKHEYDVLICTTIIESGLDVPNVNTIIVDEANRFGLAQLYQIRGRVGRSNTQAYAYCYYDPDKILSTDAKDRLRSIREFTTLGSGYQIALRDLEIRGVGNILGSEQHGHMVSIGFDLYCEMLEDSIEELQGNAVEKNEQAVIDLNITAFIPEDWVGDLDVKLTEYKRLADVESDLQLKLIQEEWRDRFGDVPAETLQLVKLVKLRLMGTELGFTMVRSDDQHLRVSVPYTLQEWMFLQNKMPAELGKKARWIPAVTSSQGSLPCLLIKHLTMDGEDQVEYLMDLFKEIIAIKKKHAG